MKRYFVFIFKWKRGLVIFNDGRLYLEAENEAIQIGHPKLEKLS